MISETLIDLGNYQLSVGQGLLALVLVCLWLFLYFKGLNSVFALFGLSDKPVENRIRSLIVLTMHMIFVISLIYILGLNFSILSTEGFDLDVINVLISVFILQVTRHLDLIGIDLLSQTEENSYALKQRKNTKISGSRSMHLILICLALLLLIGYFGIDRGLTIPVADDTIVIHLSNVLLAILAILLARLIYWFVTSVLLQSYYHSMHVDRGVRFAFNQLIGYVIFTIGILFALQNLGVNMSLLWGGAAALLVGVGLGLQQTFADFFAGIVLLFERSVKVGDVLKIHEDRGVVTKIGLRTSTVMTPKDERVVIPNSQLTNVQVVNWSSESKKLRYGVTVGVAYGSDIDKVESLLLESVKDLMRTRAYPKPFVRLNNFGDSDLSFGVYFYSDEHMDIEIVKSELRKKIYKSFADNNITIPFPQRDIWIKKD